MRFYVRNAEGGALMKKYFQRLYGNEDLKRRLGAAVSSRTLPHALLICGPEGSGKFTLAKEIAAAINCTARDDAGSSLPCGRCNNCRRIHEGIFPDVKILERDGSKATVSVEQTRDFREDMFLSPTESDHKVYILKDTEVMTTAAQNALLKVIEEPPENTYIFLLTADQDKILTTIKSRAQFVQMQSFSPREVIDYLTSSPIHRETVSGIDGERIEEAALASLGVIGGALSLLDERQMADTEKTRALVCSLLAAIRVRGAFSQLYLALTAMPTSRAELKRTFEFALLGIRDAFTVRSGIDAPLLFFKRREDAEEYSLINSKRLTQVFDIITAALEDIDRNVLIPTLLTDVALAINQAG